MKKTYLLNGYKKLDKPMVLPHNVEGTIYASQRTIPQAIANVLSYRLGQDVITVPDLGVKDDLLIRHDQENSFEKMLSFYKQGIYKEVKNVIKSIDGIVDYNKDQIILLDKEHFQGLNFFLFKDNVRNLDYFVDDTKSALLLNFISLSHLGSDSDNLRIGRNDGEKIYAPSLMDAVKKNYKQIRWKKIKF